MTAIVSITAKFQSKLKEIIADTEAVLSATAYSPEREASQNECVVETLVEIESAFNAFMRALVADINADLDVLDGFEKADLVDASFATIVGNWDYQFKRRAEELRDGATNTAGDRIADDRRAA